ncbi:unnamed protein product [Phytomonas sp. EM1]|nr:unnamed protein product [Phytomonas sp. EM1]|eukprot:CCW62786.1 unnamed protein product [Phytomonas sp. isolate EM1]
MGEINSTVVPLQRYIPLTPSHEEKIDALLKRIEAELPPPIPFLKLAVECNPSDDDAPTPKHPVRVFAYMYLLSRGWDVERAFAMAKAVYDYRKTNHLDEVALFPPAFSLRGWDLEAMRVFFHHPPRPQPSRVDRLFAGIGAHFSAGLHYWDKSGLPVLYLMIGRVDVRGLLKRLNEMANIGQSAADVFWEHIQHIAGVGELLLLYQQHLWNSRELQKDGVDASEGLIRSATVVVDARGLRYAMLWKPALDLFKELVTRMFQYYPNCMHRVLVINCPTIILLAYNLVKGIFDKEFRKKISLLYPKDSLAALEQLIDKKHIPHFLGGECRCEGTCIEGYFPKNCKSASSSIESNDEDASTENITISAGTIHERSIPLKKGESVMWEFAIKDGKEIHFSSFFIPSFEHEISEVKKKSTKSDIFTRHGEAKLANYLIAKTSPTQGAESYFATDDGVLLLVWDNKKSWFSSRKLQMRVFKRNENENTMSSSFLQHSLLSSSAECL